MISEEIRGMIPDYVRGLLSSEETDTVKAALAAYPELLAEYEAAGHYYAVLKQLPESVAPAGFLDKVNRRIDKKPKERHISDTLFKPFYIKIPLEFAGLAACLVVVVMLLKPQFPQDLSSGTSIAQKSIVKPTGISDEQLVAVARPSPAPQPAMAQSLSSKQEQAREASSDRESKRAARATPAPLSSPIKEIAAAPSPVAGRIETSLPDTSPTAPAETHQTQTAADPEGLAEKAVSIAIVDIGSIELDYVPSVSREMKNKATEREADREALLEKKLELNERPADEKALASSASNTALSSSLSESAEQAPVAMSELLDPLFVRYDSLLVVSTNKGKVTYTLTLSPDLLSPLSRDLERSFKVTSHLLPFDPLIARKVRVSFTVKE